MTTTNPAVIVIGSIGLVIACLYVGGKAGSAAQFILSPKTHPVAKPAWVDAVGSIAALAIGFGLVALLLG